MKSLHADVLENDVSKMLDGNVKTLYTIVYNHTLIIQLQQTFCKSSYLRNKTLGSSLCFHHPRTWSFHLLQPTIEQIKTQTFVL